MIFDKNGNANIKDVMLGNIFFICIILAILFCLYEQKQNNIVEQYTYTENGITYRYTLEKVNP